MYRFSLYRILITCDNVQCHEATSLARLKAMWRIFKSLGLYSQMDYGDAFKPGAELSPLDDMNGFVRRARVPVLRSWAGTMDLRFALLAISLIADVTSFFLNGEPCNVTSYHPTNAKYQDHFHTMVRAGLIRPVESHHRRVAIKYISTYFSVPKTKEVARSVFNGKRLSKLFRRPPPVNIPEVRQTTRRLVELGRRASSRRRLQGFTADIRHWFHQIPVEEEVSRYFGVCMGEDWFEWRALPMGWSYSPFICQCMAWTAILHIDNPSSNEDGLMKARQSLRGEQSPPQYVTLYYDAGEDVGLSL
jgi:hypothetical protein